MRILLGLLLFAGALYSQSSAAPPTLAQYLGLTDAQVQAISEVSQSYSGFSSQKAERAWTVRTELTQETAKETLDPMALGLRYLELEAIHRALVSENAAAVKKVQALMTPEQIAKLNALNEALKLYPTACNAALGQYLIDPNRGGTPAFVDGVYGLVYPAPCGAMSGNRVPVVNVKSPQIAGMTHFSDDVQSFLSLSDDQILQIEALQITYRNLAFGKTQRQSELKAEIVTETQKDVMDPMALGVRYAELETIRRELVSQRKDTVAATQKVLDSTQAAKLATLDSALKLQLVACSAASEYLLTAPEYASMRNGDFSGAVSLGSATPCVAGVVRIETPINSPFSSAAGTSVSAVQ